MRNLQKKPPEDLPCQFAEMMREGKLFTGLILSTTYSQKYKGQHMTPNDSCEVVLPAEMGVWNPTLLGRYLYEETTPFIWRGDSLANDSTLYVAFGPLAGGSQVCKIACRGSDLELDQWGGQELYISSYMKRKLDHLWAGNTFYDELKEFANTTSGTILFCGLSHGAALAQAAALKFALCKPQHSDRVHVASWNAYKWTDEEGSALAKRVFGEGVRCLSFVVSEDFCRCGPLVRRRYDSVPEWPLGYSSMHDPILLDCHEGTLWSGLELQNVNLGCDFFIRACSMHWARSAIKGMKAATIMAREQHAALFTESCSSPGDSELAAPV